MTQNRRRRKTEAQTARLLTGTYGVTCYLIFLAAFLYAIGFVGNVVVPRSIDNGVAVPIGDAAVVSTSCYSRCLPCSTA